MREHEDSTESMIVIEESGVTRASDYDAYWSTLHLPGEDGGTLCGATARGGRYGFYMSSNSDMHMTEISISDWLGGETDSRTAPLVGHPHGQTRCHRCLAAEAEA